MSYSFDCIKKCFTHKKNTRVEVLSSADSNRTDNEHPSSKRDIWATFVPKTFQAAQTPLGRQSSNVTAFAMPPPKRSASPKTGNVKLTKEMQIDSLDTMNPFTVPVSNKLNDTNTISTMSMDINKIPSFTNETMSINSDDLPKSNSSLETMVINSDTFPIAETMSIDFNNLPKSEEKKSELPGTMAIDLSNMSKTEPTSETMSILPNTMTIDFNNLPKADVSMETVPFNPDETMSIDFNQIPSISMNSVPGPETMSMIPTEPSTDIKIEEGEDDENDEDESLPEDETFELGVAGETLFRIRKWKIAIVYEDEDIEEIERKIKEDIESVKKVNSIKVNRETRERLQEVLMRKEWPLAFVKGDAVGGLNELRTLSETGVLTEWLKKHDYDLIVIGGGSGGLAAAKEAARLGKKVACLDFVKPSPQGSTWGLGGTCVNVGCIPKKLMHQASLLGHSIKDAKAFGWQIPEGEITHSWKNLKDGVQDHIASLNWGYRVQLREKLVNYVNAYGSFSGPFEISATNKKGKVEKMTADRFLIATGLRPRFPDIPGAQENCITSDDLFALSYPPGKTLCVGASYVSLECAGFLKGIGFDVTVMVRSILLRGFDQDIAERIRTHMVEYGIKFERGIPSKIEEIVPKTKQEAGLMRVYWSIKNDEGEVIENHEDYNTVVMAVGREAAIDDVKLETLGVTRSRNGKVLGRREQSLGCPYVYAIGDVLENTPELTPVAIQAGRVLMRRLYLGSDELTEYDQIPTTVFTPLEYGCCGLSEEESFAKYGEDNIVVYHSVFNPLEYTIPERMDKDHCYCKLICVKNERDRIVGYHILTPNAGEVTQGFAIALKLGGRKRDFDRLIGIHPTVAENFTTLTLIKKEGEELKASGC